MGGRKKFLRMRLIRIPQAANRKHMSAASTKRRNQNGEGFANLARKMALLQRRSQKMGGRG